VNGLHHYFSLLRICHVKIKLRKSLYFRNARTYFERACTAN